ncbi:uncharacterized protein CcaverHIS019_0111440 [Cutaneotrichosporon cavernicola]|uniref:Exonuclease domain-containing protein n=1 Tax=Cutaneotrichosporon cavernicola TaxID=279322 RepID=A0AA48ICM2_9TREE|nr:uncharacterized protein CcaverHIS019_0111440 [Cutaneotrichosporon cavernicola]BEI88426.1 hypothetical protein CcaverHIS019_0111440 [Cutaneotrichosporon cavernicola]BEJ03970.1 hypothetical protein CcaverHIS641_0111450 [Cutaneotrichosporon cavernicola]
MSDKRRLSDADDGFTVVSKRKQRKMDRHRPKFHYDTGYFTGAKRIGIAHIRDLSLYIVAEAQKPQWLVVEHHSAVTHTVVVLASGLLPEHLGLESLNPNDRLPFSTAAEGSRVPMAQKLWAYGCPTRAPGDNRRLHSVMGTLLRAPLPEALRKKREGEIKKLSSSFVKGRDSTPLLYVLTPDEMVANGYRLPSYVESSDRVFIPGDVPARDAEILAKARESAEMGAQGSSAGAVTLAASDRKVVELNEAGQRTRGNVRADEGWVETPRAQGPPPSDEYLVRAIDCEMVLSEDGQELARVSVVDLETGEAVFDELVTPPKPVTDYVTQWSGMTEKRMAKAKYTLETVQEALVTGPNPIITPHTILLGHSLDCDMASLKIRHPLIIDTTHIYRHARGPPFKPALKWLTKKWLGREIQGGADGHDSREDARACVDLLRMKLQHGPDFGDPNVDSESVFERINRTGGKERRSLVADYGNPRAWFGAKATTVVACTNDDEVVDAVAEQVGEHEFVFARLTDLANVQNWNTSSEGMKTEDADEEVLDAALARFDARLTRLHESLPLNSALVVLTGHADPRPMLLLAARQRRFEAAYSAANGDTGAIPAEDRWTTADDRDLEAATAEARQGMAFFCVR